MATKTSKAVEGKVPAPNSKEALAPLTPDEWRKVRAKVALLPATNAAAVMVPYTTRFQQPDFAALTNALKDDIKDMCAGDMKQAEAMLYAQAQALQSIFMNLAQRAAEQDQMKWWDGFLRMALKAQNQCRMTLETLSTIKNPPVVFAHQANVQQNVNNGGQQQVNNGAPVATSTADASAPAANSGTEQTELLETSDGERLDTRAQGATGDADPQLAAVGKVDGAPQR